MAVFALVHPPLSGGAPSVSSTPTLFSLIFSQAEGFSDVMIDAFFRPFLGGIFFDTGLQTSSRLLLYVLCMLASGERGASVLACIEDHRELLMECPALLCTGCGRGSTARRLCACSKALPPLMHSRVKLPTCQRHRRHPRAAGGQAAGARPPPQHACAGSDTWLRQLGGEAGGWGDAARPRRHRGHRGASCAAASGGPAGAKSQRGGSGGGQHLPLLRHGRQPTQVGGGGGEDNRGRGVRRGSPHPAALKRWVEARLRGSSCARPGRQLRVQCVSARQ